MGRKHFEEMIAEALREAGVLVFVFATLDGLIAGKTTVVWTLSSFAVSGWLFGMGLYVERRRPGV